MARQTWTAATHRIRRGNVGSSARTANQFATGVRLDCTLTQPKNYQRIRYAHRTLSATGKLGVLQHGARLAAAAFDAIAQLATVVADRGGAAGALDRRVFASRRRVGGGHGRTRRCGRDAGRRDLVAAEVAADVPVHRERAEVMRAALRVIAVRAA